jgi:uncharacterized sporulation protein YeaH/YhbH (DUF444 family)
MFRDVVSGTTRKELKKWTRSGRILRRRGGKTISIPIPKIDLPHFVYGKPNEGIGSGPGQDGDVVGKEPADGNDQGEGGTEPGDAIEVDVDMQEILKHISEDWQLPNMTPKPNSTFEEVKIRYNSLSRLGPPSLLHKRKTLLETLKRMSAMGQLSPENARLLPGHNVPIVPLTPIRNDMKFRTWTEKKIPSSNAVIFFARDISGSMTTHKCEIVSDMSWWIDMWIRQFYDKTQRCYVVHDTRAWEVDEKKFYKYRMGGGTVCSTALKYIAKQLKHRFPPQTWNVYVFYFSDGDNYMDDNSKFIKSIKEDLNPQLVNLVGITQILPWSNEGIKEYVDKHIQDHTLDNRYVRTAGIDRADKDKEDRWGWWMWDEGMEEGARNEAIKQAIKELLGDHKQSFGANEAKQQVPA